MTNLPFKSSSHISSSEWKSEIKTLNNVDVRVYEPINTDTPVIISAPQISVGDPTFSVDKIKRTVAEILGDNIHAPVTCQALLSCSASGEIVPTHTNGYHLLPVSGKKVYDYLTNIGGGGGTSNYKNLTNQPIIDDLNYTPPTAFPSAGLLISDNLRFDNADLTIQSKNHYRLDLGKNDASTALPQPRNYFSYDVNVGGFNPSTGVQQAGKMTYTIGSSIDLKSPLIRIGHLGYGLPGSGAYPNATTDIELRANHVIQLKCDDVTCQQDLNVTRALSVNNDFGTAGQVLTSNGAGNTMSWATPFTGGGGGTPMSSIITADSYTPPAGFPTAGYKISDNLRLDNSDLTVEGALNITGTIGAAGSQTSIYQYSSFNHAGAAALGFGRTNISVGNTILCAADSLVVLESDDRININAANVLQINANEDIFVNVGKSDGSSPLPSGTFPSGQFKYNMDVGGFLPSTNANAGLQQAGFYQVTSGSSMNFFSPQIRIGQGGWGNGSYIENQQNRTTHIYLWALNLTQMNAANHHRYGNFTIFNGYLQVLGPAYASTFISSSDDRLKHNEKDLTDCLRLIRKLKPQKYQKTLEMKAADFNGELNEGEYTMEAGFIAQDVKKDIPELNFCVKDPTKDNEPYHLDYTSIFTHHIAATKELDNIVTGLLAKIATLEARITELENK